MREKIRNSEDRIVHIQQYCECSSQKKAPAMRDNRNAIPFPCFDRRFNLFHVRSIKVQQPDQTSATAKSSTANVNRVDTWSKRKIFP